MEGKLETIINASLDIAIHIALIFTVIILGVCLTEFLFDINTWLGAGYILACVICVVNSILYIAECFDEMGLIVLLEEEENAMEKVQQ